MVPMSNILLPDLLKAVAECLQIAMLRYKVLIFTGAILTKL